MEVVENIAYGDIATRQKEQDFPEEKMYEVITPKQKTAKNRFNFFHLIIAGVALLGFAFGIAAFAYTIARSSNQDLENRVAAQNSNLSEKILSLEDQLHDAGEQILSLN